LVSWFSLESLWIGCVVEGILDSPADLLGCQAGRVLSDGGAQSEFLDALADVKNIDRSDLLSTLGAGLFSQ
jgi:hypothetical protein